MNRREAIKRHKERLANLTEEQAVNLMVHAANKTPLLDIHRFCDMFIDTITGEC